MAYETVSLGNISGGMNEMFPPSRIRENEAALLENVEYMNGNIYPQTRRGTHFLASFDDTIIGVAAFHAPADTSESHAMVVTTDGSTETEFWGREPSGSFTTRGTQAVSSSKWQSVVMNNTLIFFSGISSTVAVKWTGSGNVANLGGTPPNPIYTAAVWNNRMFAVDADDKLTIEFCQLGDSEDWTDTDPISGAGFVSMTTDSDPIVALAAHRERLIIFRQQSIWQIMTSLPNTDPAGWRLELLTNSGGCDSKYTAHPILNDLIFHSSGKGKVALLRAVEFFGDFNVSNISANVNIPDGAAIDFHFAGVVENKYLITTTTSDYTYCLELQGQGEPRWTKFLFKGDGGGTANLDCIGSGFIYNGQPRLLLAIDTHKDVLFWPNNGTGDDAYIDYLDGPQAAGASETAPTVKVRTRAWDGGALLEEKQAIDVGLAFRKLSSTGFTTTGHLGLLVHFDEVIQSSAAYSFSDAASGSVVDHAKRVRLTGRTLGTRFHSIMLEINTLRLGLAILFKDFDARITQASRAFHDTIAQV